MDQKEQALIKSIIDYWYIPENWDRHTAPSQTANKRHFFGGEEVDNYIKTHFMHVMDSIEQGKLEHWKQDHYGRLAYILACDQFPRNSFRKSPKSYAFDKFSIPLCDQITSNKEMFHKYKFFERQFIILPYMHSENLEHQQKSIDLYEELSQEAQKENLPEVYKTFQQVKAFSVMHYEPIKQYGRFPSRNIVLGRQNTEAENEYIKNGGQW